MRTIILFLTIILFSFNSCEKETVPLNRSFELKYGVKKIIYDTNIEIKIDSVSDNRCPIDVVCVWEGNAIVSFILTEGNNDIKFKLNTHSNYRRDTLINHYRIRLTGLNPPNRINPPNKLEDYKAELIITNE